MKTKFKFLASIALLSFTVSVFSSCTKDDITEDELSIENHDLDASDGSGRQSMMSAGT